jgi:hypothetical protein
MDTVETYLKKQESDALFSLREGENPLLKFVQVGKGNRINPPDQSRYLIALRGLFEHMGWKWGEAFCAHIEDYQTTCSDPHGAREMLLEAIQFDRYAEHDRNKSSINLMGGGSDKK